MRQEQGSALSSPLLVLTAGINGISRVIHNMRLEGCHEGVRIRPNAVHEGHLMLLGKVLQQAFEVEVGVDVGDVGEGMPHRCRQKLAAFLVDDAV